MEWVGVLSCIWERVPMRAGLVREGSKDMELQGRCEKLGQSGLRLQVAAVGSDGMGWTKLLC